MTCRGMKRDSLNIHVINYRRGGSGSRDVQDRRRNPCFNRLINIKTSNPWWPDSSDSCRRIIFSPRDGVRGVARLCERERNCVLTSFSLLRKRGTLASLPRAQRWSPLRLLLLLADRLSPVRANFDRARSIGERKNAGKCPCLSFPVFPLFFFRARVITLVCEGPLAIGMKVGSCVEMESPGPRLYTHLPTRADCQDRARGPRPSSPIEPPGGASLLVFSSPPFLDSTYLISLLVLYLLLSFSSSYTASHISPSLSFSFSLASAWSWLARRFLRSFLFRTMISTPGTSVRLRDS